MQLKFDRHSLTGAAVTCGAGLLFVLVVALSAYNIWSLVLYLRPGDYARAMLAPALFDGAALVWLGVFVFGSRGGVQRLIAIVWCAAAVVAVVAANVYYLDLTSTANMMTTAERAEAVRWALRAVEAAAVAELVGHFLHYLASPSIQEAMKAQARTFKVTARAAELADGMVDEIAESAAERLGASTRRAALAELSSATGVDLSDLADRGAVVAAWSLARPAAGADLPALTSGGGTTSTTSTAAEALDPARAHKARARAAELVDQGDELPYTSVTTPDGKTRERWNITGLPWGIGAPPKGAATLAAAVPLAEALDDQRGQSKKA